MLAINRIGGIELPLRGLFSSKIEQFPIFNLKAVKDDKTLSYADSGVSIDAGDELVERIKPFAKKR